MKKDVVFLNSYLRDNYFSLQEEVKKVYYFDLDTFHDCILDLYDCIAIGRKLNRKEIKQSILKAYREFRNKKITKSFAEKAKEDNTIEFIDNKVDSTINYYSARNIRDKAKLLLSKNDFLLLDLYYYQNKPKRIISIFTGIGIDEINKRLEQIIKKFSKTISYEYYTT